MADYQPLTPAELDELERLEKEASPGEWHADCVDPADVVVWGHVQDEFIINIGASRVQDVMVAFDADAVNARLIAAARNALPRLLAMAREALRLEDLNRKVWFILTEANLDHCISCKLKGSELVERAFTLLSDDAEKRAEQDEAHDDD